MATVETELISKHGGDQPEPEMELSLIPPTASSPSVSDLVEVTEAGSPTFAVELIPTPGFRFVPDVPLKTPFLWAAQIAAGLIIPESPTMALPR